VQDFKKLRVWDESVGLAADVYRVTADMPGEEIYGLIAQMRSSVVSISSNIAEGSGRASKADKARFIQIAIGSASELESQLLVGQRLGMLGDIGVLVDHVDKVRRQLISLRDRVERTT
jgi:four helix bundle protein